MKKRNLILMVGVALILAMVVNVMVFSWPLKILGKIIYVGPYKINLGETKEIIVGNGNYNIYVEKVLSTARAVISVDGQSQEVRDNKGRNIFIFGNLQIKIIDVKQKKSSSSSPYVKFSVVEVENIEKCKRIFGTAEPDKAMNIFFVGFGYNKDEIFCDGNCDLNNYNKNLQNDINRMLYDEKVEEGYGLLTIEPFASNLENINLYLITKPFECNPPCNDLVPVSFFIGDNCGESFDFYNTREITYKIIIPIFGYEYGYDSSKYGGLIQADTSRTTSHGFVSVVSSWLHEFGHELGLLDLYPSAYDSNTGLMGDSYSVPNCDNTPGCPKWCNGEPIPSSQILSQIGPACTNYLIKEECEAHSSKGTNCLWLSKPDPYFNSRCIQNGIKDSPNIGEDCLEGTGCYWGCSTGRGRYTAYGYRPIPINNFANKFTQRVDEQGKKHVYEPVSERYISDIFECAFPDSCGNYNYQKCSDFFSRYSKFKNFISVCDKKETTPTTPRVPKPF